jgi:hypothetical protein
MDDSGVMDDEEVGRAQREASEREDDEAACLKMLADADQQVPPLAAIAGQDRAVARELEMEAECLRRKAAERTA